MSVVADVNADSAGGGLEHRISEVSWTKVELLPETWSNVWNVVLPIFSEVRPVSIDNRGGVVIDAGHFLFVDRHHHHHSVLAGKLLHVFDGGALRNMLDHLVPAGVLLGTEVRSIEEFLKTEQLHPFPSRFLDERQMLVDHAALHIGRAAVERDVGLGLNQPAANHPCHVVLRVSESTLEGAQVQADIGFQAQSAAESPPPEAPGPGCPSAIAALHCC